MKIYRGKTILKWLKKNYPKILVYSWSYLKNIYFSYIHSYLNYANIAWASTSITKLKPLLYKQKQGVRIVSYLMKAVWVIPKSLFKIWTALNIYKINLFQPLNFKYSLANSDIPVILNDIVKKPKHKYSTKFLSLNYTLRKYSFTNSRFSISFREPKLWNEGLNKEEKGIKAHTLFKKYVKLELLDMENECSNFLKMKKPLHLFYLDIVL